MIRRMIGAARLDARTYQELCDDPVATLQAFAIILLSSLALAVSLSGIVGSVVGSGLTLYLRVLVWTFSYSTIGWVVLSLLAYWVGSRLMRRTVTFPSLLRAIGFANVPGLFYVLLLIPGFAALLINAAILLWILVATIVALRQTLQVSKLVGFWMAAVGLFIAVNIRGLLAQGLL